MIEISLTVRLDAGDLATLGDTLAAIARGMAFLRQTPEPVVAVSELAGPTAQNGPFLGRTDVREENVPATVETPQIVVIPPTTAKAVANDAPPKRNTRMMPTLPWAEYDALVRKEMKRLSLDRRLPGRKLWEEQRDRRLPTLDAVRIRYKCATMGQLAQELGMEPPLHNAMTVGNGAVAEDSV